MPPSTTESNRAIHNDPVGHDLSTVDKLDLGSELEARGSGIYALDHRPLGALGEMILLQAFAFGTFRRVQ